MLRRCPLPRNFPCFTHAVIAFACIFFSPLQAREISIAFIDDGAGETTPRLSQQIVEELQPLLNSGDILVPIILSKENLKTNARELFRQANSSSEIDYIIATNFIGSQEIYLEAKFPKPTYLLRVIDPNLTGIPARNEERNLRSYSSINGVVDVFQRISTLFNAKRVGLLFPASGEATPISISSAVAAAAKSAGIEVQFLALDFDKSIAQQLPDFDAVLLPPISMPAQQQSKLIHALQNQKIPSYAVGSEELVLQGALISDTIGEDNHILARRVALDLQLAIAGEVRTTGMRMLKPKKRTTINIDTARLVDIDLSLDELMAARVVQGNVTNLKLSLLSSISQATDRNLGLRGQQHQLNIDMENLEQARAARRPQLAAQIQYTKRGEALPDQDTLAAIAISQKIYSPTTNAQVKVAELGLEASESSLQQKQLDTIQQTASTYFQALQTQAQYESSLRDLALNRENLSLAENRKRSGSGAGADVYRWQAIIANSESALLRAYIANTRAQNQLAQLLNSRIRIPTTLSDVDLDQPPFDLLHEGLEPYLGTMGNANLLREASAARAIEFSPLLAGAAAQVSSFDTNLKALKRAYYTPELSLSANYGYYLDSTATAAGNELDDEGDWSLSVTAELPLWLGGTRRSLVRQYAAQSALADTQLRSTRMALWSNSGDAVNNLVANYRAIGISKRAEAAALKSQQIIQQAYKLGAASVTELLDTQNSYREAQDNAHIARYQYLTALVDFQALMGDMPMLKPGAEQQQWLHDFLQSMLDETVQ